jgi:chemotaxis protein CheX
LEKIVEKIPMPRGRVAMADASEPAQNDLLLQLPAVLDLKAAGPLAAAFLARRGTEIIVGAGDVQRLGGQCLQVLLSAQASWGEDDQRMVFETPSPEFVAALHLFGADGILLQHQKETVL